MEAVALLDEPAESKLEIEGIVRFLDESKTGETTEKTVNEHTKLRTAVSEKNARFTTEWSRDEDSPCLIHENIIQK
jgi:hypothetical protein